jgi:hypothetical protein
MLYLRRRLCIPDKSTDWLIWQVASKRSPDAVAAMGKMSIWAAKVLAERAQLGLDQMDEVIRGMTEPERSVRSPINAVVRALECGGQDQEGS